MIPSGFLPLFFTLPIVIYYAFIVSGKVKFNDRLKENHDAFERGKKRRIVFRAKFKPQPHEGTVWKLRNCNQFVWTKTTVLIERRVGEAVDNEKHDLGVVTGGENVVIESKLSPQDLAHWRIMVICPQGRLINFPEQWVEAIPEAKTEEIMEELPA